MPSRTPEEGTEEPGSSLRDTDAGLKGEKMGEGVAICRSPRSQVQEVPGVNVSPCHGCPCGSRHPAYTGSPP